MTTRQPELNKEDIELLYQWYLVYIEYTGTKDLSETLWKKIRGGNK